MRLTRRIFFIGFGLTALVAVGAYWWQLPGLAGVDGIAPIGPSMEGLRRSPELGFFDVPTLLWISSSDAMLHLLCAVSVLSSLALIFGFAPRIACITLWACWSSLVQLGHPFLSFQWDVLLIETAFCAAFYAPPGIRPRVGSEPEVSKAFRFVMIVLAVKVTLESGIVKVMSGDPSWRDLTALTYHWWSQPLPTWTSELIAQLPLWIQKVMCGLMFVFELLIPVMAFGPRVLRIISALGLMLLQAALYAAGNYSFYNVLTFVIAIPLLDDEFLSRLGFRQPTPPASPPRGEAPKWVAAIAYLLLSVGMFARVDNSLFRVLRRVDVINAYGAFAVMTKNRSEIIIEGSADGVTWLPYEFPWKPGDLKRRPTFIAPWQPRLDWQMWFAGLSTCANNTWLLEVQEKLLHNSPAVLKLFETNPFSSAPPKFMRTRTFEYRFAPWSERGVWWTRTETGPYCPAVMLAPGGELQRAPF